MKIFDLLKEETGLQVSQDTIGQEPEQTPRPADQQFSTPMSFTSKANLNNLSKELAQASPDGRFVPTGKTKLKPVEHIRVFGISRASLLNLLQSLGFKQDNLRPEQTRLSTKYAGNIFSFSKNNEIYSFVLSSKGLDDNAVGVGIKEYSPTNLGLAGKIFSRNELISATKQAVENKTKDNILKTALLQLVDIAVARGHGQLTPELNDAIASSRNQLSVDFGEVLAPIAIMDDNDKAEFPVGNEPLIDVRVGKQNISVKSLSGSGTSFRSIANLMDKYEASMDKNNPDAEKYNILKSFHPSAGGNNKDKIISASFVASTAENLTLMGLLNISELKNFQQLTSALAKLNIDDYGTFLKTFYPAMIAGDWGKPVGLPADGAYYMGTKKEAPKKVKVAGKVSFDNNPIDGGADILTYVLGVGLLNFVTKGSESEQYSKLMTDIVNKADAVIGKIDITVNGGISVTTRSFNNLKFQFQYHAPSHIPGNNLPGFIAILD